MRMRHICRHVRGAFPQGRRGGLTLGIYGARLAQMQAGPGKAVGAIAAAGTFEPNAFVRIGTDNTVTVDREAPRDGPGRLHRPADARRRGARRRVVAGARRKARPPTRRATTTCSGARRRAPAARPRSRNSFEQYRKAGAAARAMLVAAAAQQWKVPADSMHGEARRRRARQRDAKATFGELADAAAKQPVPADGEAQGPEGLRLHRQARAAHRLAGAKSNGTARLHAGREAARHADRGGRASAALRREGASVRRGGGERRCPACVTWWRSRNGVAVVATTTSGRRRRAATRCKVEWDDASGFKLGSAEHHGRVQAARRRRRASPRATTATPRKALAGAAKTLEAAYEFPYLAHAAMEPMNCVVQARRANRCEVWNGEQFQTGDQMAIAQVHRAEARAGEAQHAATRAAASAAARTRSPTTWSRRRDRRCSSCERQAGMPVKLVWTREDDMRGGYYRPMYVHALQGGPRRRTATSSAGSTASSASRSSPARAFESMMVKDGIDLTSVEGASQPALRDPASWRSSCTSPKLGVPVLWWRSVGSTHTAFSTETFIDELAAAAGKDPVAFRRALLGQASAPPGGARARGGEGGLGQAAGRGQGGREARPRHRRARVVRHRRRAGRRSHGRQGQHVQGRSRRVRRRLRHRGQSRRSCARRWKAASASACRPRCTARSR